MFYINSINHLNIDQLCLFDESCCEVLFANIKFPFFDTNNISMRLWIVNDDIWYHEEGILIVQFEIVKSPTKISNTIISDQMKWQILKNISFGPSGYHPDSYWAIGTNMRNMKRETLYIHINIKTIATD